MGYLLKGALVEYGSDVLGPLPNVLLFQFNPDQMVRTLEIPSRPTGSSSRESNQAGDIPLEKLDLTARFSAADMLDQDNVLARASGIQPQLAALEQMVHPSGTLAGLIGAVVDKIADAIGGADDNATQPVPRENFPRLLFIWGLTRVLPVFIHQMSITETRYDYKLSPIEADVRIGLTVFTPDLCGGDEIAKGALEYSKVVRESLAATNLANTVGEIETLIEDVIF